MMPSSMRRVVVLPAPFGPSKATRSPGATARSIPATACIPRNDFTNRRALMTSDMDCSLSAGVPIRLVITDSAR